VKISSLVPVQTAGTKPPLFMVHSYLIYHGLSGALGNDQPFYGLRELSEDKDESLEERALRYIVDIRSVQPHGPYRIAGWCASGPLAMEIARQLILTGEEVALLALFDSRLPGYTESAPQPAHNAASATTFARKLAYHRTKFQDLSGFGQMKYFLSAFRRRSKAARDRFYTRHWSTMSRISRTLKLPLPQFMHNSSLRMLQKLQEFRVESIPVRLTLIRATDSRQPSETSNAYGWEQVAELGVDVLWAPGDHETMFRGNNLKVTAKLVREALASAQSSVAGMPGLSSMEVHLSPR
jgi:thioesterase domain-containing protein